jgi:hypothetical protein
MNEEQAKEMIELLKQGINELKKLNELTRRQVHLFEKYDAEVFEEEEIKRDIQNSARGRRR